MLCAGFLELRCFGMARSQMDTSRFIWHRPRPADAAELLRHSEARLDAILMESRAEVSAAEPGAPRALDFPHLLLRRHRGGIEDRMGVVELRHYLRNVGFLR